ncbi:MAG: tRNA 2-thiouridine(34) synthase MnmA [Chloroflexota bacterium]
MSAGKQESVVVAMSGGVDSSVAAALLKEEGYQVIGITMQIWPAESKAVDGSGCCGLGAVEDARQVAYRLGIPHYVIDLRGVFEEKVIADFCREYSQGRTPNPCVRCNQHIKFGALWQKAAGLGADFIATGHYARIEKSESTGRYLLKKGLDQRKDQSYFLYALTQQQMGRTLFPVGALTKDRVREIAGQLGLPVAHKPASQEICFIPDGDYAGFIREHIPQTSQPGPILDGAGGLLGSHRGILSYTIGQRQGLGVSAKEPLYVTSIDTGRNAVVVGSREMAYSDRLTASGLNWIARPELPARIKARIRHRHPEAEAELTDLGTDKVLVKFTQPQLAITPGQAVVFYDNDTVIGGGTIEKAG